MIIWVLKIFFVQFSVYSCHLFLISSASVRSLPFLSFFEPIFAWNVPLVSLIFLKRSLVFPFYCFPLFLCIDHWRRLSYLSLLFSGTLHSNGYIFPFLLCFLLPFSVMSKSFDPMDCSPPGSSVHEILQARILEWVTISFSRESFWPLTEPGSPSSQADSLPSDHQGCPGGILLSHEKERCLLFAMWMDLESIMLKNKVEKDKYTVFSFICEI